MIKVHHLNNSTFTINTLCWKNKWEYEIIMYNRNVEDLGQKSLADVSSLLEPIMLDDGSSETDPY